MTTTWKVALIAAAVPATIVLGAAALMIANAVFWMIAMRG